VRADPATCWLVRVEHCSAASGAHKLPLIKTYGDRLQTFGSPRRSTWLAPYRAARAHPSAPGRDRLSANSGQNRRYSRLSWAAIGRRLACAGWAWLFTDQSMRQCAGGVSGFPNWGAIAAGQLSSAGPSALPFHAKRRTHHPNGLVSTTAKTMPASATTTKITALPVPEFYRAHVREQPASHHPPTTTLCAPSGRSPAGSARSPTRSPPAAPLSW
jgi:hypothetical protein